MRLSELKNCPYGCRRTKTSLSVRDYRYVYCDTCDCEGPNAGLFSSQEGWRLTGDQRKNLAMELWNCRSPSARRNLLEEVSKDRSRLNNGASSRRPESEWVWAACVRAGPGLVEGVEYRVLVCLESDDDSDEYVLVKNDLEEQVEMPREHFAFPE